MTAGTTEPIFLCVETFEKSACGTQAEHHNLEPADFRLIDPFGNFDRTRHRYRSAFHAPRRGSSKRTIADTLPAVNMLQVEVGTNRSCKGSILSKN